MRYGGISIRRTESDSTCDVIVSGELDMSNVDELRAALDVHDKTLPLDTTELAFIDSAVLAIIVEIREEIGPDRFELIPGHATSRLLEITQLEKLFFADSRPGPAS